MLTQIDLSKFADYMIETIDCSDEYEDDQFGVEFDGERFYIERYPTHFYCEDRFEQVFLIPRF